MSTNRQEPHLIVDDLEASGEMTLEQRQRLRALVENFVPTCRDLDEDCEDLDHLKCYLYDPAKGRCPFLSRR